MIRRKPCYKCYWYEPGPWAWTTTQTKCLRRGIQLTPEQLNKGCRSFKNKDAKPSTLLKYVIPAIASIITALIFLIPKIFNG